MTAGIQLLTVMEVAGRLRLGKSTVYKIIANGEMGTTPVGCGKRRLRIRVSERQLEAFIASRELPPRRPRGYR